MKTLYLDIFSGISGDMFLAALLDLGVKEAELRQGLGKLDLAGYHLHVERAQKSGISGVRFVVHLQADHPHSHESDHGHDHHHDHSHAHPQHTQGRDFATIRKLILASDLSVWVKERAIGVFQRIASAEGRVHGLPPEKVHFHEVGAVDSIVDIVGACLALELLGKPRVLSSPVVEGTGFIQCAHGRFPVPAPATLAILGERGIPLQQCEEPHELVTPTGAAILAEFSESFGPMPGLVPGQIGYGIGTRENKTRPNVLRAVLGDATTTPASANDWETDTVAVLETNIDDLNPEILGHLIEGGLASGALDVFHTPIQMKKNRPGVLFSLLCAPTDADRFTEWLLRETSAFGVRRTIAERRKLRREFTKVSTPFGEVSVKLGSLNGRLLQAAPEYESCRQLAERASVPLKEVYAAAVRAAKDPTT